MKQLLFCLFVINQALAQNVPFASFKRYPFPTELTAASMGNKIAWALDEQGRRNIYVAEGPDYKPVKITHFEKNDGQEITSLCISGDGKWVVFVRGGEHSANWDGGLPVNPGFDADPFKVQVASVPFQGGETKYLSEGDNPVISPDAKTVAFIKAGQPWSAPLDGSSAAKNLFTTRGTVGSLQWSPDGTALVFSTNRTDHSLIGIFSNPSQPIKWVAPSFNHDEDPQWSVDGSKIVFVRFPGSGGIPDSILARKHHPWSLVVADLGSGRSTVIWKAPRTLRGSTPSTDGGVNLHWAAADRIVFLSYQDGWPHLYSLPSSGGSETLLTPGSFMCEHIRLSADKKFLSFSANTGDDKLDLERRHVVLVSVDHPDMKVVTPGSGLEWTPVVTGDGQSLAFISAGVQQCPVPAVMSLQGNDKYKIRLIGADLVPLDFPKDKLITPKQVVFTSADGVTVHADLFLPEGGPSRKPAIVYLHGGPPRQMLLGWHYSDYYANAYACNQYLASMGFVVLAVNYRLGIGYGYEFQHPAKAGPSGASEYQDIKAAGLWLQKQTYVDRAKIGIYGGSYGGYLTAMALGRDSKIFAAGVDIHGVHDWVLNSSIVKTSVDKYEKAPDYDQAVKTFWNSSPVSSIATWTSPVLIIHADDDRNVRFFQSVDLIQRLEKKGVPYETLMIVDDTHHWLNWNNAVTVYGAVADYFIRKFKP